MFSPSTIQAAIVSKRFLTVWLIAAGSALAQGPANPLLDRPKCISFFLKQDYQLDFKQKACDWIQNRMFSQNALVGAAFAASFSQIRERSSDRGKGTPGFSTRFSTNFAQSAAKSTGAYLGGLILREDPRDNPPYVHRTKIRGFWPRLGRALGDNFISYRCAGTCDEPGDVRRVFALSRVTGAFASGFSSMAWAPDRLNTPGRALRRTASAYGSSFGSNVFAEFKPEITAIAEAFLTKVFGMR